MVLHPQVREEPGQVRHDADERQGDGRRGSLVQQRRGSATTAEQGQGLGQATRQSLLSLWRSDKQDAFVKGIALEFPDVPHRYCQHHFLRDRAKPMLEADSHAKVQMRKKVCGLRTLSPQQRRSLGLFLRRRVVTAKDIAAFFGCSPRSATALCVKWSQSGFLVTENPSTKGHRYRLAEAYESLVTAQAVA